MGSWSFGDYGKPEAVNMAWDLLTNVQPCLSRIMHSCLTRRSTAWIPSVCTSRTLQGTGSLASKPMRSPRHSGSRCCRTHEFCHSVPKITSGRWITPDRAALVQVSVDAQDIVCSTRRASLECFCLSCGFSVLPHQRPSHTIARDPL